MLSSDQIRPRVEIIANAIRANASTKPTATDTAAQKAIVELATSTLEALHAIAWHLGELDSRDANRR